MMFQRYILVILAVALCLVAAAPVLPQFDSVVQGRDGSATPTTYQVALSLVESSSANQADITTKDSSMEAGPR
ncbi:hypothetical protein M413DRAFT_261003 [Hebeloma cylindrosporum]|uniref:Uncharacterized protein n=1 Tax=Hebeloma cylindrosporum TaxID=76867 RepID=A0A0C3CS51_HEBCY|nr:hypothetical protein M413DRAFT_261003 [Hebeloma cylindrosporum h7]